MRSAAFSFGLMFALQVVGTPILAADAALTVIDESGKTHSITAADIAKLPHRTLKAKAHDAESEFTGVPLVELLELAGVEFGEKLKGARASTVLVVEATDNYRTAIALLEIDPATADRIVLVADKKDGKPLDEKEGPLRLVVSDDKRPIRWVRSIKTLRVVNLKDQ